MSHPKAGQKLPIFTIAFVACLIAGSYAHASLNPTGTDNQISNNVLFDPWLASEPTATPTLSVSNLGQFKADGTTAIAEGETIDSRDVVLKATVGSTGSDDLKLQVELRPFAEAFDGTVTHESAFVAPGTTASVSITDLADATYHWRARAVDGLGNASEWVEFGAPFVDFEIEDSAIEVVVVLAEISGVPHSDASALIQPCKLLPTKTYVSHKAYYEDMFFCVNDYYSESSYQTIRFRLKDVLFQNESLGEWFELDESDYGDHPPQGLADTEVFIDAALSKAGIPLMPGTIYAVVHAGSSTQDGLLDSAWYDEESDITKTTLSEHRRLGVWLHELTHLVGSLTLPLSTMMPDTYLMGNIGVWDLMATGAHELNEDHPTDLTAFSKEFLGWLTTGEIKKKTDYGTHEVAFTRSLQRGAPVFRYNLSDTNNSEAKDYYIIEARKNGIGHWDDVLDSGTDPAILLYRVNERFASKYGDISFPGLGSVPSATAWCVNMPTAPDGSKHLAALSGDSYADLANFVRFTATGNEAAPSVRIEEVPSSWFDRVMNGAYIDPCVAFHLQQLAQYVSDGGMSIGIGDTFEPFDDEAYDATQKSIRRFNMYLAIGIALILIVLAVWSWKHAERKRTKKAFVLSVFLTVVAILALLAAVGQARLNKRLDTNVINKNVQSQRAGIELNVIPDVDLHVWCDDGRHVGMNYETGIYENEIENAVTNGDQSSDYEWIYYPPEGNEDCRYSVSAHDVQEFLQSYPEVTDLIVADAISYDIVGRYVDPVTQVYSTQVTTGTFEVGALNRFIMHELTGTTDVSIAEGVVDVTAPTVTILSGPSNPIASTDATLVFTADEGGVSYLCALDGSSFLACESPASYSDLAEGNHLFEVSAVDPSGNEGPPAAYAWTVAFDDDGDGITNALDHCPTIIGTAAHQGCPGSANVTFQRHTVGQGSNPGSTKEPVVGAVVKVFDKADACVAAIGNNPHDYEEVYTTCTAFSEETTDANGQAITGLLAGSNYTLISVDPVTGVYAGVTSGTVDADQQVEKFIQVIVRSNGTSVPGKTTKHVGSLLYVIEPEYIAWNEYEELYPFIFDAPDGEWDVTVAVTPPEGFTADHPSLSTDVNNDYKALQFTLTDVGSCWHCGTDVEITIKHLGKTIKQRHNVKTPMTERFATAKGLSKKEIEEEGIEVRKKLR